MSRGIIFSCFTSSHVKLCYITLWHVTSFQVTWQLVSYRVRYDDMSQCWLISRYVWSNLMWLKLYPIIPFSHISCHVKSCNMSLHHVTSFWITLCLVSFQVRCNVMDCLTSCHFRFHIMSFKSHSFGSFLFVSCNLM